MKEFTFQNVSSTYPPGFNVNMDASVACVLCTELRTIVRIVDASVNNGILSIFWALMSVKIMEICELILIEFGQSIIERKCTSGEQSGARVNCIDCIQIGEDRHTDQ
jgi:hypothetical protein